MTKSPQSESVENFLKAVYTLQKGEERVSTNTLRDVLNITAPSVTDMAQRLVALELVDYQKYQGVLLTPKGVKIALNVIRRHRLIELYLVRELGYELHEVHAEAEALEHAVSEHFIDAIARKLGDPGFDPHGDPIPTAEGLMIPVRNLMPLSALEMGDTATVAQLKTSDPDMLQHILDRGFTLDSPLEIVAIDPFDGPITARINGENRLIGHQVADYILVQKTA
ncbi:MAG: metal-dependent transcriptional regulator [Anaerolineae bacterium]|uniref:metal-dependent transcriptional regulator n=1 Tax=Candidatus Flexifilum breve TaxID=3140694 RepID=UPI001AD032AF|nr:metal-dependent transcriptional regulator [Chloroflexota bacterium]MBK9746482.1 metal-dependent transcriptional regulator [Chloroflexota bacterium]MBN8633898.1 metal-dependent transcriptional regulator [Anaerolineae bacterium]